jgi:hypothetical protein
MHTNETKDKFIELRAQGWSLPRIATEIHVSQRTLVDWTRECAEQIRLLCAVQMEALQEKILASQEVELTRLARLQQAIEDQLAGRNLAWVSTEKLFQVAAQLRHEIQQLRLNNRLPDTFLVPVIATTAGPTVVDASATPETILEQP